MHCILSWLINIHCNNSLTSWVQIKSSMLINAYCISRSIWINVINVSIDPYALIFVETRFGSIQEIWPHIDQHWVLISTGHWSIMSWHILTIISEQYLEMHFCRVCGCLYNTHHQFTQNTSYPNRSKQVWFAKMSDDLFYMNQTLACSSTDYMINKNDDQYIRMCLQRKQIVIPTTWSMQGVHTVR